MDQITVNTEKLLEIVKENRHTHKNEYTEAYSVYRDKLLEEVRNKLFEAENDRRENRINPNFRTELIEPTEHLDEYDTVIGMLDLHIGELIELSMHDYQQYVQDKWTWKETFSITNSMYSDGGAFSRKSTRVSSARIIT